MPSVGLSIDFGTSHTVAVLRDADGGVTPLLFDGSPLLVSAVFAGSDGTLEVGRDATHSARLAPQRFEPHPKRRVDDGSVLMGEVEVNVSAMFAAVLRHVGEECRRAAGSVPPVTVTHPATWGPARRQVLIDAAEKAGLPMPRLVPEPVAAATYFSRRQGSNMLVGSVIVVYDLGGGTFDVSVVQRTDAGFDVLAADGSAELGGIDIDHALMSHVGKPFDDAPRWSDLMAPQTPDDRRQRRLFLDDVRSTKERLSRHSHADLLIPLVDREVHLTRQELEDLARPFIDKTVRLTQAVIRATGKDHTEVAGLFLVGGASRMPLVATLLHQHTGITPTTIDQPETVVAHGAIPAPIAPSLTPAQPETAAPSESAVSPRPDLTQPTPPKPRQNGEVSPLENDKATVQTSAPKKTKKVPIASSPGTSRKEPIQRPAWLTTVQVLMWLQISVVLLIGFAGLQALSKGNPRNYEEVFMMNTWIFSAVLAGMLVHGVHLLNMHRLLAPITGPIKSDPRFNAVAYEYIGIAAAVITMMILVPSMDETFILPYFLLGLVSIAIIVIVLLSRQQARKWFKRAHAARPRLKNPS